MSRLKYLTVLFPLLLNLNVDAENSAYKWEKSQVYYSSKAHRLEGRVIKDVLDVRTVSQCAMQCYRTPGCESLNYHVLSHVCELSEVSDVEVPVSSAPGWNYYRRDTYAIEQSAIGPCSSKPCHNGAGCINRLTGSGEQSYLCICKKGFMGETCDEQVGSVKWSSWSDWGVCSVTCGAGWQIRSRQCNKVGNGVTGDCTGPTQEYRTCPGLEPCPYWGEWSEWAECSVLCGEGSMVRERECLHGGTAGDDRMCMGFSNETKTCYQTSCSAPVKVSGGSSVGEGVLHVLNDLTSSWVPICADQWTPDNTNVACKQLGYSGGAQAASGSKSVAGDQNGWEIACTGTEATVQSCHRTQKTCESGFATVQCSVSGGWSAWSVWGECSVTCAHGTQLRTRTCDYPPTLRGGAECPDSPQDSKPCVLSPCPVDGSWKPWSDWQACNLTCGGGWQLRNRECSQTLHGGADCTGATEDFQQCNTHNCPVDCVWDAWSQWGQCTKTCGSGQKMRTRTKTGPFYGGVDCVGDFDDWNDCNTHECPVDCVWEDWAAWQECSVTCGGGEKQRERGSVGPFYDGADCDGSTIDTDECNMHECPVDCVWDMWSEWNTCNRTCGGGWQERHREADGPYHGGQECIGDPIHGQACHTQACPVDCVWNTWSPWGECDVTCDGGIQHRSRSKEGPQHGGDDCVGLPDDQMDCNTHNCPEDGYWSEWSDWGECSETCADGIQHRSRSCVEPKYGGADCVGDDTQSQACFLRHCPVDGEWHQWSGWAECTTTCGGGVQDRSRRCEQPLHGGDGCDGEGHEERACNEQHCPVDGLWEMWSEWEQCSLTCGGGVTSRQRECTPPQYGGLECLGESTETKACNELNCPVDGYWNAWSDWFECSVTCDGGTQKRERTCEPPKYDGLDCLGEPEEERPCGEMPCPEDGQWSGWSQWSECSLTCGSGEQARSRNCGGQAHGGDPCDGPGEETQQCNTHNCPIDCVWSEYTEWGACNTTCGGGQQMRARTAIGPEYGGAECEGDAEDWKQCNTHECPIDCVWQPWSDWAACDNSCGGGTQGRLREMEGPFYEGQPCIGNTKEVQDCNMQPCPVDCEWNDWTDWQQCSLTCGGGMQTRSREAQEQLHGGQQCNGESWQEQDCNTHPCPIDCVWTEWSDWELCSVTCGGGTQGRNRTTQGPLHGGAECMGADSETQSCNSHECPVDCVWSEWSVWETCSVTCGGGTQSRARQMDGPFHGGAECIGDIEEQQECNTLECPVDCVWDMWADWQECTVTCGGGEQVRTRQMVGPFHDGAPCIGDTNNMQTCNTHECPVDCVWSEWSDWEECSATCGTGQQSRDREEVGPFHDGAPCVGDATDTQDCNTHNCPIDGIWKNWGEWVACTLTCGGGKQRRSRECTPPQYNGNDCVGPAEEEENCNEQPCPIPGDWLPWTVWGMCSVTCGGGLRTRTRDCDMESYGDLTAPCEGDNEEQEACHDFACSPLAKTCNELVERGLKDSTWVEIDPDGDYGWQPFRVWCDISPEGEGITVIHHNYESETPVKGYEGAGEYKGVLVYKDNAEKMIAIDQVIALVEVSASCKQFISWSCSSAAFNPDSVARQGSAPYKLTYWKSRYEDEENYWGDVSPAQAPEQNIVTCGCYLDKSCADPTNRCNCDSNDSGVWRKDEGYLTYKDDLPVTEFRAGDTGETQLGEEGAFKVGALQCRGEGSPNW